MCTESAHSSTRAGNQHHMYCRSYLFLKWPCKLYRKCIEQQPCCTPTFVSSTLQDLSTLSWLKNILYFFYTLAVLLKSIRIKCSVFRIFIPLFKDIFRMAEYPSQERIDCSVINIQGQWHNKNVTNQYFNLIQPSNQILQ